MHLPILLLALLPPPGPAVRTGDFEKVTEERLRAAYSDARAALESEVGAHIDAGLTLKLVAAADVSKRITEENLPLVRLRQPDEEKAKAEAEALGDAIGRVTLAKYSWSAREFLVVPKSWEANAREFENPAITSDATLRAVLVHELVHAWDDATYGLTAFVGRGDSVDATNAIGAILEGHAQHVARRVCKARGWSAGFETFTGGIGALPESAKKQGEAMLMLMRLQAGNMSFMYGDGERFVAALEKAGGADAIARAFREPPRDGETILHPDWFLDPKKRPASLYDVEPALDLFAARFPKDAWSSQRLSLQSNQLEAAFALLPKEESAPILASIRGARLVALNPTANPAEKTVALSVIEFGSAAEASAYLAASGRLSKLKDEQMKTGTIRITGSSESTIEAGEARGRLHTKQLKSGGFAFEVTSMVLARGKLVIETVFSGEPIESQAHAVLGVELLDAVKLRELK